MGTDKCRVWRNRERVRPCTRLAREILAPQAEGTNGEPLLTTETSRAESARCPCHDHPAPECLALPRASRARRYSRLSSCCHRRQTRPHSSCAQGSWPAVATRLQITLVALHP